jgi:hypothetical protein
MTLSERITAAAQANLPLTLSREDIIELDELFDDASDTSDLASDISSLAGSKEFNGTGSYRLSVEQVKYIQANVIA